MTEGLRTVSGSLITIGDEILFGDIPNGNAHHIAVELRATGFRLERMVTIGDEEDAIVKALSQCHRESQFLIVTGGLGPTDDDRTNAAVSRSFHRDLVSEPGYMQWLKERLAKQGRPWSEQVAKMAHVPQGAIKLGVGMAGYFLEHEKVPCYFLPGVPHEMKTLLKELVIPDLKKRFPQRLVGVKEVLRLHGYYESELNRRLLALRADAAGVEIGYLPHDGEVRLTLLATAESEQVARTRIEDLEAKIIALIGREHVIGRNQETLEKVIGENLRARGWRLAVAESCTGGLVARKITAISGASDYFDRGLITYSNAAKEELLKVPKELAHIVWGGERPRSAGDGPGPSRGGRSGSCPGYHRDCRAHGRYRRKTGGHGFYRLRYPATVRRRKAPFQRESRTCSGARRAGGFDHALEEFIGEYRSQESEFRIKTSVHALPSVAAHLLSVFLSSL